MDNIKPNEDDCGGCEIYSKLLNKCEFIKYVKVGNNWCPCKDCLLKGICRQSCREYGEYFLNVEELKDEIKGLN